MNSRESPVVASTSHEGFDAACDGSGAIAHKLIRTMTIDDLLAPAMYLGS